MRTLTQVPNHQGPETEVDVPLSLLAAFLGLALLFGPRLGRWWRKRRDARRP
jgi:hypothetical protein